MRRPNTIAELDKNKIERFPLVEFRVELLSETPMNYIFKIFPSEVGTAGLEMQILKSASWYNPEIPDRAQIHKWLASNLGLI